MPARTFRASRTYTAGPGLFVLLNVVILVVFAVKHLIVPMPLFGALGIGFLALFLSAITLRVTMDAEGLTQQWLWGRRQVGWHQIASVERTKKGVYFLGDTGKEILATSTLTPADQQAILDEALKRGRLRKDKQTVKLPVLEKWVRK